MKRISTISALFLLPSLAFCCSCLYYESFCELITANSNVASVRIFDKHLDPLSMKLWVDVVVEETLQGIVEHDTMTILASHGTSCDPGFEAFNIDDKLIVHIRETYIGGPTSWVTFDFNNGCHEEFIRVVNDEVTHIIEDKWVTESYGAFKSDINTCANLTHVFDKEEIESFISLYPVPAANEAFIEINIQLDYELTVFSATGQLLRKESVLFVQGRNHKINISDLPNGVYFLRLQFGEVSVLKRLLIQQ